MITIIKSEGSVVKTDRDSSDDEIDYGFVNQIMTMTPLHFEILIHEGVLDYKTLASARLVSRHWNKMLNPTFFKKSKLSLLYEVDDGRPQIRAIPIKTIPETPPSLPLWALGGWNPFFSTTLQPKPKYIQELDPSFADLFTKGLDGIKTIEFHPQYRTTFPIHILLQLLDCCPYVNNLIIGTPAFTGTIKHPLEFPSIRSLTLSCGRQPLSWNNCNSAPRKLQLELIFEFMQSMPNLDILEVSMGCQLEKPMYRLPTIPFYTKFFEACDRAGFLTNLTEISLWKDTIRVDTFEYLSKIRFQNLKRLKIGKIHSRGLNTFLTSVSHCLKELWIEVGQEERRPSVPGIQRIPESPSELEIQSKSIFDLLPQMPKLESFTYHSWTNEESETIDFIKKLPNLGCLILHPDYYHKDKIDLNLLFPISKLYSSYYHLHHLEMKNAPVMLKSLRVIIQTFPQLMTFHFYHNTLDNFSLYFQELSKLKKLKTLKIVSSLEEIELNQAIEQEFQNLRALERFQFFYNKGKYPTRQTITLSPNTFQEIFCSQSIKKIRLVNVVVSEGEIQNFMAQVKSQGISLNFAQTPFFIHNRRTLTTSDRNDLMNSKSWPHCKASQDPWDIWDSYYDGVIIINWGD